MLLFEMENGAYENLSLIRLSFAHHANGRLSFARLLTKKQMEVIANYPD
jgi:hypothetical protein